jgi:hypothetical protein
MVCQYTKKGAQWQLAAILASRSVHHVGSRGVQEDSSSCRRGGSCSSYHPGVDMVARPCSVSTSRGKRRSIDAIAHQLAYRIGQAEVPIRVHYPSPAPHKPHGMAQRPRVVGAPLCRCEWRRPCGCAWLLHVASEPSMPGLPEQTLCSAWIGGALIPVTFLFVCTNSGARPALIALLYAGL